MLSWFESSNHQTNGLIFTPLFLSCPRCCWMAQSARLPTSGGDFVKLNSYLGLQTTLCDCYQRWKNESVKICWGKQSVSGKGSHPRNNTLSFEYCSKWEGGGDTPITDWKLESIWATVSTAKTICFREEVIDKFLFPMIIVRPPP